MVFYAYAKTCKDDATWRYVIVAPSLNTMNEWYAALRDKVGHDSLWREANDFYVFDNTKFDMGRCTWKNNQVPQFMNKMIFTLVDDVGGRSIPTFNNHYA